MGTKHRTHAMHLPYRVKVGDEVVAKFAHERDARGFARARYGSAAVVEDRAVSDFQRIYQAIQAGIGSASEVSQQTLIDQRIVWTAFTKLKRQGKIRKVGVSPDPPYRVYYEAVPCA